MATAVSELLKMQYKKDGVPANVLALKQSL